MTAEMAVGYGGLRERYTSDVTLDPARTALTWSARSRGPVQDLGKPLALHARKKGEGCEVDFSISFEFKSRLLHGVAGQAFEKVMLKMADAFEARAAALSRQPLLNL